MKIKTQLLGMTLFFGITVLLNWYIDRVSYKESISELEKMPVEIQLQHKMHEISNFEKSITSKIEKVILLVELYISTNKVDQMYEYYKTVEEIWHSVDSSKRMLRENNTKSQYIVGNWKKIHNLLSRAIKYKSLGNEVMARKILENPKLLKFEKNIATNIRDIRQSLIVKNHASYFDTFTQNQIAISSIANLISNSMQKSTYIQFVLALIFMLLSLYITKVINKNVSLIKITTDAIGEGELAYKIPIEKLSGKNELADVAISLNSMIDKLNKSMVSVEHLRSEVEQRKIVEKSLIVARNEANKMSEYKTEFLSNVSHEIRTPLTAIIGNAEIITEVHNNKTVDKESVLELIDKILSNAEHLLTLINDILDLSKIEAHKLEIKKVDTDIYKLFESVMEMFKYSAAKKNINMILDLDPTVPRFLICDPIRTKQVLINLLNNAIKFTHHDGEVKLRTLYEKNRSYLEMHVIDNGVGIPSSKIESLFNSFTQLDTSSTRTYGGSGLGLTISRQLCVLMEGNLTCTSKEEIGSTFVASIAADIGDEEKVVVPSIAFSTGFDFTTFNILVAEDWKDNQDIIKWHLSEVGVKFKIVENGHEALTEFRKDKYDLVLMDIQMPVMDGIVATKNLRECGYKVPIIALTANVMSKQLEDYVDKGFSDVMGKPYKQDQLQFILQKHLDDNFNVPDEGKVHNNDIKDNKKASFQDFLLELKERFIKRVPALVGEIDSALLNDDFDSLKIIAHSVKSSTRQFELENIARQAEIIEFQITNNQTDQLVENVNMLKSVLSSIHNNNLK